MEITTQTRHGGAKAFHVKRIPFGWDTGWGKGRDSTEEKGTWKEMRVADWPKSLFPGWTMGNSECPAEELRLLAASTGEPLKVSE